LQFSLQAAGPETFGYIHIKNKHSQIKKTCGICVITKEYLRHPPRKSIVHLTPISPLLSAIVYSIFLEGSKYDKLTKARQEFKTHLKLETDRPPTHKGKNI